MKNRPAGKRVSALFRVLMVASLVGCTAMASWGCRAAEDAEREDETQSSLVDRVRAFRSLLSEGDYAAARAMMASDARRWWGAREGEGQPWTVGENVHGPWANWDDYFRSTKEIIEWKEAERYAIVVIRETNDYYRLLERESPLNEVVYYFDEDGKIDGLVIRSAGERDMGRTEAFRAWAQENASEELAALMPDGEIDPTGDHPQRFRALLNRWRRATGREPIE